VSDTRLRGLERAAAQGDPEAQARLITEHLRAGGRDPRIEPREGDVVVSQALQREVTRVRTRMGIDEGWVFFVRDAAGDIAHRTLREWRRWAKGGTVLRLGADS
jgi:hypothetical protein